MKKKIKQLIAMLFATTLLVTVLPTMEAKAFESLPSEINGCTVTWSDGWGIGDVLMLDNNTSICCPDGYGFRGDDGYAHNIESEDNTRISNISEMTAGTYHCASGNHTITLVAKPIPTPTPKPVSKDVPTPKAPVCSHNLVWGISLEPTVEADGVESLKCTKCGYVEMQQKISRDAVVYNAFANELEKQIKNAKLGDTLKLDFNAWHSVPQFLMERIISCGYDVELLYKYEGTKYDITIKKGCGQNLDIPWYGPLLMNSLYGN